MTHAASPPAPTAAPALEANLAFRAKVFVGVCAALTTVFTAGINGWAGYRTAIAQADDTSRKSDVRKLEDQFQQFTGLARVFVAGLNAKERSEAAREAVAVNVQQQYDFLGTLEPMLGSPDQRARLNTYRQSLVDINKTLKRADDVRSAMPFARAVSESVDARIALVTELRRAAGLPIASPASNAMMPARDFGAP